MTKIHDHSRHDLMFLRSSYVPAMPDERLRPATEDEIAETLSYALRFDDRGKPNHVAREFTASITARQLIRYLNRAGFVIMKKPPAPNHSAG